MSVRVLYLYSYIYTCKMLVSTYPLPTHGSSLQKTRSLAQPSCVHCLVAAGKPTGDVVAIGSVA